MARRKTLDPAPTLFPFLSVLAAVIGTLILIISGMSQIALANPKQRVEIEAWNPAKKSAVYVECRAEGLRIHRDDPSSGPPLAVRRDEIADRASPWFALLRRLERDPSHYVLFLVRDSGVGTFQQARTTVSGTAVDFGYEPLFGEGDVQFQPRRGR